MNRPPWFCNLFLRNRRTSTTTHANGVATTKTAMKDDPAAMLDSLIRNLKRELSSQSAVMVAAESSDCDVDRRHVNGIAYLPESIDTEHPRGSENGGCGKGKNSTDMVEALRRIISKYDRGNTVVERDLALNEWRKLAQSVDRVLFWLFLCAHVGGVSFMLVVLLLTKHR